MLFAFARVIDYIKIATKSRHNRNYIPPATWLVNG